MSLSPSELTSIERTIQDIADHSAAVSANLGAKLSSFLKAYNNAFSNDTPTRQGKASALVWALFPTILLLYASGNNSSAIVDIYSLIEKLAIRDLPSKIAKNAVSVEVIKELINRKNLPEIAPYYKSLGIWDENDIKIVNTITKARNGVAHKNEAIISKLFNSGKPISYLDIEYIVNNQDAENLIISSINLLMKLSEHYGK